MPNRFDLWETVEFEWGTATKDGLGNWRKVIMDCVEIDVSDLDIHINEFGFSCNKSTDLIKLTGRYGEGMKKINDEEETTS